MNGAVARRLVEAVFPGAVLSTGVWRGKAACGRREAGSDWDPEMFWPEVADVMTVREAKRMCARCPVRPECLEECLAMPDDPGGIWGGTTPRERGQLRATGRVGLLCQGCGGPVRNRAKYRKGALASYCDRPACRRLAQRRSRGLVFAGL